MKPFCIAQLVEMGLREDLENGDVTTSAVVDPGDVGEGRIVAREPLVVSGVQVAEEVFRRVDPRLKVEIVADDGAFLDEADPVIRVEGRYASILSAERVALNFLCHLSGVATLTRRFVRVLDGTRARIVDTRKSIPGYRLLEKAAVRHGGGHNHRFNLSDGVLIKDNHIVAAGGIEVAVARARANAAHHLVRLEVEVDTLEQLREALECGVEVVMLDNMSPAELAEAVSINAGRALLEASGGVRLETVRAIAETGVDLISAGSLIHGARWVDMGLDLEAVLPPDGR